MFFLFPGLMRTAIFLGLAFVLVAMLMPHGTACHVDPVVQPR